ncbi:MAG: tryptophan synthase subunit alpha, partial [Terriglobales bacterium]
PVLRYGFDKLARDAKAAGIDGCLLTDASVEEAGDYVKVMRAAGLDTVFLAAPTSTDERLKRIADISRGFVYAVSRTGVTGARQEMAQDAQKLVRRLRKVTKLPVAVGFGISTAAQFAAVGGFADAAVVGSAIMQIVESTPGNEAKSVGEFVRQLTAVSST